MKQGKFICKTLKTIRKQIADANEIPYETTECKHEGDCAGTCPKCEQEVRYIENQLIKRRALGKAVAVVGLSVGLAALSSCRSHKSEEAIQLEGDVPAEHTTDGMMESPLDTNDVQETTTSNHAKSMVVQPSNIDSTMVAGEMLETMPRFPGGQQALNEFLTTNIKYPDVARKKKIEGNVVIEFVVEKDGSISSPKLLQSVHPVLDAEAMRVVNIMPKWIPANRNGESVSVKYSIPVKFKL
ncbi:MAG: energy transducer TonB [Prevotella sp.]|nr:energy transducer TonB [Prevotella sp.]